MIRLYEFFYWAIECGSAAYNTAIKNLSFYQEIVLNFPDDFRRSRFVQ